MSHHPPSGMIRTLICSSFFAVGFMLNHLHVFIVSPYMSTRDIVSAMDPDDALSIQKTLLELRGFHPVLGTDENYTFGERAKHKKILSDSEAAFVERMILKILPNVQDSKSLWHIFQVINTPSMSAFTTAGLDFGSYDDDAWHIIRMAADRYNHQNWPGGGNGYFVRKENEVHVLYLKMGSH